MQCSKIFDGDSKSHARQRFTVIDYNVSLTEGYIIFCFAKGHWIIFWYWKQRTVKSQSANSHCLYVLQKVFGLVFTFLIQACYYQLFCTTHAAITETGSGIWNSCDPVFDYDFKLECLHSHNHISILITSLLVSLLQG